MRYTLLLMIALPMFGQFKTSQLDIIPSNSTTLGNLCFRELSTSGTASVCLTGSNPASLGSLGLNTTDFSQLLAGGAGFAIKGITERGQIDLQTGAADAAAVNVGAISFSDHNNANVDKRIVLMRTRLEGTTANNRGGQWSIFTRADGVSTLGIERLRVDSTGLTSVFGILNADTFVGSPEFQFQYSVTPTTHYGVKMDTTNVLTFRDNSGNVAWSFDTTTAPSVMTANAHLNPGGTTATKTLGTSLARWSKLWAGEIDITGEILPCATGTCTSSPSGVQSVGSSTRKWFQMYTQTMYVDQFGTDVIPDITASRDLGTTTFRWRDLFLTRNAVVGGNLTVTGTCTGCGSGVTSVSGTSPIVSSGGTTPFISCATCITTAGGQTISGSLSVTQLNAFNGSGTGQVRSNQFSFDYLGTAAYLARMTASNQWDLTDNSGNLAFSLNSASANMVLNASLLPTPNNTRNLGASSNRWIKMWATDVDVTSNVMPCSTGSCSGGVQAVGNASNKWFQVYTQRLFTDLYVNDLITDFDNARDLGSASFRWRNFYLGNSLIMSGTTVLDSSRNGNFASVKVAGNTVINSSGVLANGFGVNVSAGVAATGYNIFGGAFGVTTTANLTNSVGGTCSITFTGGIITASTC